MEWIGAVLLRLRWRGSAFAEVRGGEPLAGGLGSVHAWNGLLRPCSSRTFPEVRAGFWLAVYWETKLAQHPTSGRFAADARYWRGVVDRAEAAAKKAGVRRGDRKKVKPADAKPAAGAKRRRVDLAAEEKHCRARLDRATQRRDRHTVKETRRLFRTLKAQHANPGRLPALAVVEGARLEPDAVVLPGGTRLPFDRPWAVPDGHEWTGAAQIVDVTRRVTSRTRPEHRKFTMRPQLHMTAPCHVRAVVCRRGGRHRRRGRGPRSQPLTARCLTSPTKRTSTRRQRTPNAPATAARAGRANGDNAPGRSGGSTGAATTNEATPPDTSRNRSPPPPASKPPEPRSPTPSP